MQTQNQIENFLFQGKFDEARECLNNGEKFNEQYLKNNFSQIAAKIIDAKEIDFIEKLIKAGFIETDIYELDSFDQSIFKPLTLYLKDDEDSITFFKELMSKMDNLNDEISDKTLLGYFLEKGISPKIVQVLVDVFGANTQYKNNAGENFIYTVLNIYGLNPEKVKEYITILIDNGVDINEKNIVGTTPLMCAVKRNRKELLPFLLENGADANETDNQNNTAFYYAVAEQFSYDMYDALASVSSPNFNIVNKDGRTLFTNFISSLSVSPNNITFLERLLSDGVDVNFCAQYYGQPKSGIDFIVEKKSDILKSVLENVSLDVNEQDNEGNTILHKVCAYNVNYDAEMAKETYRKVKLLLDQGADISITNDKDETALMLASGDNLKIKTVELLMKQ
ncbi:ankyrin repeat domain-containing protein [Flavobacterium nitrogenifigens]|uniref:Ankyrin repeat-containing protein n=1 Tax=Flavobacterium nitrogenifigens TaxID=1617283 RepID=A0A521CZ55_9FLAO|nr:ankyrin repeat domain-containing protein [Flavobacterium nitrogenifigens]KAF2332123.1 ankyrin repeat domain-containing protein [Flavobacterium nitrogenifigens]SMO64031.1 Ankyrin repeat-containing protein [Flavobacterium nitrogenifigens]